MANQTVTLSALDSALSRFLAARANLPEHQKDLFAHRVATLSKQQSQGHSCILLDAKSKALVLASGLATAAEDLSQAQPAPLVVNGDRLYFYQQWFYEQRLAQHISSLCLTPPAPTAMPEVFERYFTPGKDSPDWQQEAAKMAVSQIFCLITGGPGTGKTTTVVKILAILLELAGSALHIALAAPTGKAAMRLQEALIYQKQHLPCSETIKTQIPETATTLHRLLGAQPPSPHFRHNAENPLSYDVVVVDEASMVDLALMSKLVYALKPQSRLILLGDKDQLTSVEAGAVLADLSAALPYHTVDLKTAHRFGDAIKTLAQAIRQGQADTAWHLLQNGDAATLLRSTDPIGYIAEQQEQYLTLVKNKADYPQIFAAHARFQTLCANRQGKYGVIDINLRVQQTLLRQQRIQLAGPWYSGRPVQIVQNAPHLHLYNGDTGLCLPDYHQNGALRVFFQQPDGSFKKYLPNRLPACETAFAMTIHKSQGSEFPEILVVLPETANAVLSRELLYTAVTRAKQSVKLAVSYPVFAETLARTVQRATGLLATFNRYCGG